MSFIMHTNSAISAILPVFYVAIHKKSIFEINPYESDLSAEHEPILNHLSFHMPTARDRTLIFERLSLPGRKKMRICYRIYWEDRSKGTEFSAVCQRHH